MGARAIHPNRNASTRPSLILASGSPQRRHLLETAGYPFEIVVPRPHAECGLCSRESPGEMAARLAYQKAADVVDQLARDAKLDVPDVIAVIGCDTICDLAGQVLGKPADRDDARRMLTVLSGREHHVLSGLCVWWLPDGPPSVRVARTTLRMDVLEPAQIEEYLESGQWQGKAGAFGYQDRVGWLHVVDGSESNVIGLPLELLAEVLDERSGGGA